MSIPLKHQRIAALLKTIREHDVSINSGPTGLFAPKLAPMGFLKVFAPAGLGLDKPFNEYELPITDYEGFTVYCSQQDNPGGNLYQRLNASPNGFWARISNTKRNLTKPSSGLATFYWSLSDTESDLSELTLCTEAFALVSDGLIKDDNKEMQNRPEDVTWAQEKTKWLWHQTFPSLQVPKITLINTKHEKVDWP